jgi:hypothetical protein
MSEMVDDLELAVRAVLVAEAESYEVPADLATRTLAAARRDAPRRRREGIRHPWVMVAAAVVIAAVAIAGVVITDHSPNESKKFAARYTARNDLASGRSESAFQNGSGSIGVADQAALGTSAAPAAAVGGVAAPQIARTADVEVRVDRGQFADRWREANEVPARHGGFVVDSSAETVGGQLARGTLTARVPAANLDAVVRDLRRLGTPVRVSDTGHDVSAQLVDFDARLRNAQAREAQLLDLLRGTRSAGAIAQVRSQLDEARSEIEGLQGQRAALQSQVDLATIQATVTEPLGAPRAEPKGRWLKALHHAGDASVTVATGFVVALGYAAPIALLAAAVWQARRVRRRRALQR